MSLFYPSSENAFRGKTFEKEDRFSSRFIELSPSNRIVQAVTFASDNPDFAGEMIMDVPFEAKDAGTKVTITFKNIPPRIRPEDKEAGTQSTLESWLFM